MSYDQSSSEPKSDPATSHDGCDAVASNRPLSTFSLTCLIVANMIGVGVFTTSGFTIESLPDPMAVVGAWALAGIIALLGAVCYGGLARQISESGGEYLILSRGIHPLAGFMAGWISLVAGFSGAIGLAAVAFAQHLPDRLPDHATAWAVALIVLFTGVNLIGLRPAARFQNVLVIGKLAALVTFACYGLASILSNPVAADPASVAAASPNANAAFNQWSLGALTSSLIWISFSYLGYNAAIYIAGAAHNCRASVPKAMVYATLGVTSLYVALNAVFVWAAPISEIRGEPEVAHIAAQFIGPAWVGEMLRIVILVSLATSVLAMVQTGPHVYAQMARDGLLPRFLDTPGATPRVGIVVQAGIAIGLVSFSTFLDLLNYLAFLLSISSAATILCLLLPAFRGSPGKRPIIGWPWIPLAFVAITVLIAVHAFQFRWETDRQGLLIVLAVVPLGIVVYGAMRLWSWIGLQKR